MYVLEINMCICFYFVSSFLRYRRLYLPSIFHIFDRLFERSRHVLCLFRGPLLLIIINCRLDMNTHQVSGFRARSNIEETHRACFTQ